MPKAQNFEEKYINGIKVDKEDELCAFNDEQHLYFNKKTGEKYTSVTQLISKYCQDFDEEFWSAYKALESICDPDRWSLLKPKLLSTKRFSDKTLDYVVDIYNINRDEFLEKQAEIKQEYKDKRDIACTRGTAIHLQKELEMYGKHNFDFRPYGFADLYGEFTCIQNHNILDLDKGVYPEFLISATFGDLTLVGQMDILVIDGNDVYIGDYKGLALDTPILTKSGWKTMGEISVGDIVYDKDGKKTKVLHTSELHTNPCYKITFDNNDTFIADGDHKWCIEFKVGKKYRSKVMTTTDVKSWMENHKRESRYIPKVLNCGSLKSEPVNLPIDPYVLGAWLGDGSKTNGMVTNADEDLWKEIERRGYCLGKDTTPERTSDFRTILGLRTKLKELGILGNKFIPNDYFVASYEQRLDLLRGLMDTNGYYNPTRRRFVMATDQEWQARDVASLVSTFGWKPTIIKAKKYYKEKTFPGYDVCFTTNCVNPFLVKNQTGVEYSRNQEWTFRNIDSIESVDTVYTKCIEVDSPTHTYLAGRNLIVTHNSNREIKKTSYFDTKRKKHQMMKAPINNLMDSTLVHYQLQLSLYARMLQQRNPKYNIKQLQIIHIDHDEKQTLYTVPYLKNDVDRLITDFAKKRRTQVLLDRDKPFIV